MLNKRISARLNEFGQIFSSLESSNYRLYFTGQSISLIGTWMQTVAMGWLVYRLTGSVFLLGVVGFTSQIPSFFLSPFAGVLIDRFNRRRIMMAAQILFMIQALLFALLVLFGLITVWHIIVLSLLFGFITAIDAPVRQALVIDLIDNPLLLGNAIALNSTMFNGARLFGPAIAGLFIAWLGEGFCFLLNAISYIAVIAALAMMKITKQSKTHKTENFKEEFKEGARYAFGFPPIKILLILLGIVSFFALPFTTLMPAYAGDILKGGSHTLGFLMSASGAGALTGALYLASRKTVLGLGKLIAFNTIIFGIVLLGIAFSSILWLSLLFMFFGGLTMITTIASINTLVQTLVDEDKRGRVMSFYAMMLMGMNPIGNFCAGSIASAVGIPITLFSAGIITIVTGIWFSQIRANLRQFTTPIYAKKGILQ
jgi:MFS family permease